MDQQEQVDLTSHVFHVYIEVLYIMVLFFFLTIQYVLFVLDRLYLSYFNHWTSHKNDIYNYILYYHKKYRIFPFMTII
jgi:hypothetical protein